MGRFRDSITGALAGFSIGGKGLLARAAITRETEVGSPSTTEVVESALVDIQTTFEDIGWRSLNGEYGVWNFARTFYTRIIALSRVMYLLNPLVRRAVSIQGLYVWGRGVKIQSPDKDVQAVLDDFFTACKNQMVIGASWEEREREQRIDGNTFFAFFRNRLTGACRIRVIPVDKIEDIVCNPEDGKEPWFYIKSDTVPQAGSPFINLQPSFGEPDSREQKVYYPDIHYNPPIKYPTTKEGYPIRWDVPVFHVKTGALSMMKFGLPELLSAMSWATGYKKFLEGFATLIEAYARVAMKVSGLGGKKQVAATKNKLQTAVSSSNFKETNPSTTKGSWWLASGGADIQPLKTAGSTTGPDEARALRCMVAAGADLPEHFFGDSDVGNFATSTTLDRPTELKMTSRQKFWTDIILGMSMKLVEWSATAPAGKLRKAGFNIKTTVDPFDMSETVIITLPDGGDIFVNVEFPNILERDVTDRVRSVVMAATLGGSVAEGIIPDRKVLCGLLLEALGEKAADHITNTLYPEPVLQGFKDPANMTEDEHLAALGKKELGDAALQQAAAAKTNANKPAPKPIQAGVPK